MSPTPLEEKEEIEEIVAVLIKVSSSDIKY
jgi:hypothetical protein